MKTIYFSVLMITLTYSIHLTFLPNSRYIALVLLGFGLAIKVLFGKKPHGTTLSKKSVGRRFSIDPVWVYFMAMQLVYTIVITEVRGAGSSGYTTYVNTTFNYFVMLVIVPPMLKLLIKDKEDFVSAMIIATLVQSIIVIMSFAFPSVRSWLMAYQNADIWEDFRRYGWRIIGLGVVGAGGSIYLSCGFICNIYAILFSERKNKLKLYFSGAAIFVAIMLVGRTGFYFACALLMYMMFVLARDVRKMLKNVAMVMVVTLAILFVALYANSTMELNNDLLNYTLQRLDSIFDEENAVTSVYGTIQQIPGISWYTLWGSGIIRGVSSNGLRFHSDSGYMKRYAAIGLLMTIASYYALLHYLVSKTKRLVVAKRMFFAFLIMLMFVVEYKEHFIFMYSLPFTILMLELYENDDTIIYAVSRRKG